VILADTSIWADHIRSNDRLLQRLLDEDRVLMHPFVIGEIALGYLKQRELILTKLSELPKAQVASDPEVVQLIGGQSLFASGVGYVDAHLLASVRLTPRASLWTRDKRFHAVAEKLGLAVTPDRLT
jgi:predicted nucleic acid-binding protein